MGRRGRRKHLDGVADASLQSNALAGAHLFDVDATDEAEPPRAPTPLVSPEGFPEPTDEWPSTEVLFRRLGELQSAVEALTRRASDDPLEPVDPDVAGASRTLRFARMTADSAIAQARADAGSILADARREREEILAEARREAQAVVDAARGRALDATLAWAEQREQLHWQLQQVRESFEAYEERFRVMDDANLGLIEATVEPDGPTIDLRDRQLRLDDIETDDDVETTAQDFRNATGVETSA